MSDDLENITEALDQRILPAPNRSRPARQSGLFNLDIEIHPPPPPKNSASAIIGFSKTLSAAKKHDQKFLEQAGTANAGQNTHYVQDLEKESTLWNDLIKEKVKECHMAENNPVDIEEVILTPEQRAYCSGVPNAEKFIQDSEKFSLLADQYLCEHTEFVEKTDSLAKACKGILDGMSYEIIYDCFHKQEI